LQLGFVAAARVVERQRITEFRNRCLQGLLGPVSV
jgi:hypothetical protein